MLFIFFSAIVTLGDSMTVGQRIREARKKAGLTQKELADKLGISYVGVSHWENGQRNPKLSTLARIADALSIPVIDLLTTEKHFGYPVKSEITGEEEIIDMTRSELLDSVKDREVPFTTEISGITGTIRMIDVINWHDWGAFYDETEGIKELLKMFYISFEAKLVSNPDKEEVGIIISGIGNLVDLYLKLNSDGRMVSEERLRELTEIPRYQKSPPQAETRDGEEQKNSPPSEGEH